MTNPHAFFASGMTSVTPAALARSSIAAMRSREVKVGRLADGSIQRAMRGGGTAPSAARGGASRATRRRTTKAGTRTLGYSIGAAGIPLGIPKLPDAAVPRKHAQEAGAVGDADAGRPTPRIPTPLRAPGR